MKKQTNHNLPALDLNVLNIRPDDSVALKLLMLVEGEFGPGVRYCIDKYDYTEQRYYQLLKKFKESGSSALLDKKRGPKHKPVRSEQVIQQIIRHRFLDPDCSAAVIGQKLRQAGLAISNRSVERTIEEYGLQKKTLPIKSQ